MLLSCLSYVARDTTGSYRALEERHPGFSKYGKRKRKKCAILPRVEGGETAFSVAASRITSIRLYVGSPFYAAPLFGDYRDMDEYRDTMPEETETRRERSIRICIRSILGRTSRRASLDDRKSLVRSTIACDNGAIMGDRPTPDTVAFSGNGRYIRRGIRHVASELRLPLSTSIRTVSPEFPLLPEPDAFPRALCVCVTTLRAKIYRKLFINCADTHCRSRLISRFLAYHPTTIRITYINFAKCGAARTSDV